MGYLEAAGVEEPAQDGRARGRHRIRTDQDGLHTPRPAWSTAPHNTRGVSLPCWPVRGALRLPSGDGKTSHGGDECGRAHAKQAKRRPGQRASRAKREAARAPAGVGATDGTRAGRAGGGDGGG